jgi:hypothetical protein
VCCNIWYTGQHHNYSQSYWHIWSTLTAMPLETAEHRLCPITSVEKAVFTIRLYRWNFCNHLLVITAFSIALPSSHAITYVHITGPGVFETYLYLMLWAKVFFRCVCWSFLNGDGRRKGEAESTKDTLSNLTQHSILFCPSSSLSLFLIPGYEVIWDILLRRL